MFDKIFGPAPDDLDDKRWKLHWLASFAAIGAVLFVCFMIYQGWIIAAEQSPSSMN